ncbi:MBL fold metallo-hydrolase [Bowmanella dokdonensis]|uniref:MBL fold metallo-hydrolase n=1 Tax=Bowmanella dokdonensis TaxID=751969 RepID=A0A939IMZ8_9ALTE|nr:MBL fold metallo-hydrolase [Bowmanella dokdonensis]MBN7824325.1 MBL fold metallo-hydrolase [Bowmanella dokdonensis]
MNRHSLLLLSGLSLLLAACASPNQVTRVAPQDSVVPLAKDGRYQNLYPGEKTYPVTCEQSCYPPHPDVICQAPAEQCRYQGTQQAPSMATGFTVRWLGHASFAVTAPDGQYLLFDPVSDQFDWPVNWAAALSDGTWRTRGEWPMEEDLARTSAVFYSHLHYDHFNKDDIRRIGNQARYFVALDSASHFADNGYQITEMAWFTRRALGELTVHAVPAHHFNSRIWVPYLYEDNERSLWAGWLVEHGGKKLFFAGDTGYSEHFKDIHQRYGQIDICLLPIASYHHEQYARWYRYVHTTPEDALTAADELGCKVMIPWGYGNASWQMGDKSSHSALLRLLSMRKQMDSRVPLLILNEGQQVSL